jgi:conjugal transfer mating pair stabilization protein TraN
MKCFQLLRAAAFAACLLAAPVAAQQQDARTDGKAFGESLRDDAQRAAQTQPNAANLPNYDRNAVRGLEALNDDPDRIESSAATAETSHEGYRAMRDSIANRARFEAQDIEDVIARSLAINETPLDFTSGMTVTGSQGACVPLPPGSASAGTYTATCNTGTRIEQSAGQCMVPLIASVTQRQQWHYLCNDTGASFGHPWCSTFDGGSCRITG